MKLSDLLFAYLAERRRRQIHKRFTIGEWLRTLTDDEIAQISELSEGLDLCELNDQSLDTAQEFIRLCRLAICAERRRTNVRLCVEDVSALRMITGLEALVRAGLVTIDGPMYLDGRCKPRVVMTERGVAYGLQSIQQRSEPAMPAL